MNCAVPGRHSVASSCKRRRRISFLGPSPQRQDCSGIQKRHRPQPPRIIQQIYITLALMLEIRAQIAPPQHGFKNATASEGSLRTVRLLRHLATQAMTVSCSVTCTSYPFITQVDAHRRKDRGECSSCKDGVARGPIRARILGSSMKSAAEVAARITSGACGRAMEKP